MRRQLGIWACCVLSACSGGGEPQATEEGVVASQGSSTCPARRPATKELPGTPPEQETLEYWLARLGDDADRPLHSVAELGSQQAALAFDEDGDPRIVSLGHTPAREVLVGTLDERLAFLRDRLTSGKYEVTDADAAAKAKRLLSAQGQSLTGATTLHVATGLVPLRCGSYLGGLRATDGDRRFDRNNCSSARIGEPVEVLGRLGGGPRFVRTAYSVGFIADDAQLSPAVPGEQEPVWRAGARRIASKDQSVRIQGTDVVIPEGTVLPLAPEGEGEGGGPDRVWAAGPGGFAQVALAGIDTSRPLTRRALLTEAFRYIGSPYGWGGEGGGRDCSRLLLDTFRGFGVDLPRTSAAQSRAATYSVHVPDKATATDRLALLDGAHARGAVLIHFPGHIMLYLGRDAAGVPRALHAFAEYLTPCAEGGETLHEVDRVGVSDLSLGEGSSRGSFLARITRLSVLGGVPGFGLAAFSSFRRAAPPPAVPDRCEDSLDVALFRSPRRPVQGEPVRVIVTSTADTRPAQLFLVDPTGEVQRPDVGDLGVGPFARVARIDSPRKGRWTAMVADGDRVLACERFGVALEAPRTPQEGGEDGEVEPRADDAPAWLARWKWERDTEALYAAFVEQLFSHDVEDTRTWSKLADLLRDPARNLLYDHRSPGEDARLDLSPDCADLPYFLRGYFAWKVGLPFGFRRCTRGRAGVPPRCNDLIDNEVGTPGEDEVAAFERYILRAVRPGVHSASGRTLPTDPKTDLYPVGLDRRSLAPGSVFVDPYGHLIVVAKWVPQGLAGEGMLLGADAQPDATVGRRRFWRGSFLFSPETTDVGAGFKAFRPLARDVPEGASKQETSEAPIVALDDESVRASREFASPSLVQYEGDQASFYARMDALIFPRPLEPGQRVEQLVGALQEQVERRVTSVDTGEAFVQESGRVMAMPEGYDIFETSGPWEDFATPSRDMRLLIAIDTVLSLPALVAAAPERFGYAADEGATGRSEVQAMLNKALSAGSFSYTSSAGTRMKRTLADVVARAERLQMAYNPNDCVEIRWGAVEQSEEMAGCNRHAPAGQRRKMGRYRHWFETRTRPARP